MPDHRRMIGFTGASAGIADFERRDVFIYVTREIMADLPHFCYSVLEAFTLTTIGQADRSPRHAGAVVRDGSVLLLTGASGAGKSTLVYAAMRSGLRVLADDAVYVQLHPRFDIWGVPSRICLLPETGMRHRFPSRGTGWR